ncbi:MAG: agmatine deiminase [Erysipelotrichales bacterium]|nr:agmatine deiminase [Erysipelotrichales bacterium]
MAKRITQTIPREDGFRWPAEFEPQRRVWMIWPERPDVWRDHALPAQKAYADAAETIAQFTPVIMAVSEKEYAHARRVLPSGIRVEIVENDDAWIRDTGPTFLKNDATGEIRAADWTFNAYGGFYDGLYAPWDKDDAIAQKVCEIEEADYYRTDGFVLEGGSIHSDGEGTVLTTEMCLLSPGRNPHLTKRQIEKKLRDYLSAKKILWIHDGIDPEETNGHVDDVACFARSGEVICIWTDDVNHPLYKVSHAAYRTLVHAKDAKGRRLRVHKLTLPKEPVRIGKDFRVESVKGSLPRCEGDICPASYLNFLITNEGVIVPQYGDEYDEKALSQLRAIFPEKKVVGVYSREIVYGGGNIHCITQQVPR